MPTEANCPLGGVPLQPSAVQSLYGHPRQPNFSTAPLNGSPLPHSFSAQLWEQVVKRWYQNKERGRHVGACGRLVGALQAGIAAMGRHVPDHAQTHRKARAVQHPSAEGFRQSGPPGESGRTARLFPAAIIVHPPVPAEHESQREELATTC